MSTSESAHPTTSSTRPPPRSSIGCTRRGSYLVNATERHSPTSRRWIARPWRRRAPRRPSAGSSEASRDRPSPPSWRRSSRSIPISSMSSRAPWPRERGRAVDREVVLVTLALALAGPAAFVCSWWRGSAAPSPSGRDRERQAWRQLWAPLAPATILLALLAGWALLEPDNAEPVPGSFFLVAAPFALVVARAVVRLVRAAAPRALGVPAATVGFFNPRVVISPRLAATLDE